VVVLVVVLVVVEAILLVLEYGCTDLPSLPAAVECRDQYTEGMGEM
jgi:hypothetical protein